MTFSEWFEGKGGSRGSIERLWDPIAYALGFIDCDNISARCMLTIFQVRAATRRVRSLGGRGMREGPCGDYGAALFLSCTAVVLKCWPLG